MGMIALIQSSQKQEKKQKIPFTIFPPNNNDDSCINAIIPITNVFIDLVSSTNNMPPLKLQIKTTDLFRSMRNQQKDMIRPQKMWYFLAYSDHDKSK